MMTEFLFVVDFTFNNYSSVYGTLTNEDWVEFQMKMPFFSLSGPPKMYAFILLVIGIEWLSTISNVHLCLSSIWDLWQLF